MFLSLKAKLKKMKSTLSRTKLIGQIRKILWITLFWILISQLQFLTGYSTLLSLKYDMSKLDIISFFSLALITGLSAGLMGGTIMVFYWEKLLRTKSYIASLLNILWSYTIIYFVVASISGLFFNASQLKTSVFDPLVLKAMGEQISSFNQLYVYLFWLIVVIATIIALLVNDKYGPGVFVDFLLGKYFRPRRETRVFMFLDLRGSTSIAEKLGETRYFNFLKDVYRHATPGILDTKGEIYQYVGDEIVVSWKEEAGIENANAIQCFFDIQHHLIDQEDYYRENYNGIVPEFKAGLHYGHVMAGEIGVVKRDIVFSGDVLNTTSRIQEKCNELGVNILISKYLMDRMGSIPNIYSPSEMGEFVLRGKEKAQMLYTV